MDGTSANEMPGTVSQIARALAAVARALEGPACGQSLAASADTAVHQVALALLAAPQAAPHLD
jgi:hypothetical protein